MCKLPLIGALVVSLCCLTAPAWAGRIDPNLQAQFDRAGEKEMFSALVFLETQVDLEFLPVLLDQPSLTPARRHENVVTALREQAAATQAPLRAKLESLRRTGEVSDFHAFWIANCYRVHATAPGLVQLAARDDVLGIYLDYEIELIEPVSGEQDPGPPLRSVPPGIAALNAPDAWAVGYTGEGMLVAHVDTGVDGTHPALAPRWAGVADARYAGHPEWAWHDPYAGLNDFPYDPVSHGTHTMGTICGGAPGAPIGVAPGARWIASAPVDRGGGVPRTVSDAMLSFEWLIDPDGDPTTNWDVPAVCCNSWGVTYYHGYPPCDETLWSFLDACESAGIVILFAAGNEGLAGVRRPADRATDDYRTLAVGAVDEHTAGWPIAGFSSRGPTYCTPDTSVAVKPEVVAPGVGTLSSLPGGSYGTKSGTSMAAPHVAGVVALIRQACPELTVEEVKQVLFESAVDLGVEGEENTYGWGMVDAYAAVLTAEMLCGLSPPRAKDAYYQTGIDLPVALTLVATDYDGQPDPPGAFTYTIESLPADGSILVDTGDGHVITAGDLPYAMSDGGCELWYVPADGFWGEDTFQFSADDGGAPPEGGPSAPATVAVLVAFEAPTVITAELPSALVGEPYGPVVLEADQGQPVLEWSVANDGVYLEVDLEVSAFEAVGSPQGWHADDNSWVYELPFAFPFYDEEFTAVWVTSNGFLNFYHGSDEYYNTNQGLIDAVRIAPMWDDLRTDLGGDVFIESAVPGEVTFRWDAVTYAGEFPCNFACTLCQDGHIKFHYGAGNTMLSPTVGISNGDGSAYLFSTYNAAEALPQASSLDIYPPLALPEGMELTTNGVLQGVPWENGAFTPRVCVTDALARRACETLPLTALAGINLDVLRSSPRHGSIDARRPIDPVTLEPQGWTSVEVVFSGEVDSLAPSDFALSEVCEPGECDGVPPAIAELTCANNTTTLVFNRPVDSNAWTGVTHLASGQQVWLGSLPGDASANRVVNADDLIALVDLLVEHPWSHGSAPVHQCDIDRSGRVTANDLIELVNLLNGVGPFEPCFGKSLPPMP